MFSMANMHRMHSDDVRTFVAVVESGSISAAARELHLTQPAVSRRVKRLEEAIGANLIDRRKRPLALTDAGRVAIERCRRVVSATDELQELAKNESDLTREVRIGIAHALTEVAVTQPIDRIRDQCPNATVRLSTGWSHDLLARVRSGSLDAAVILLFQREGAPSSVVAHELAKEHLAIIASRSWRRRRYRARDFHDANWILNPEGCAARAELRRMLSRLHMPFRVTVETYNYELQLRLIARGRGLGLVPNRLLMRSPTRPKLRILHASELTFPLVIWMIVGEVSSGAASLIDIFREALVKQLSNVRSHRRAGGRVSGGPIALSSVG
jgi:DNA-binding transcriptional LysR family regulator